MTTTSSLISWGVRESLLRYMCADPSFSVECDGRASFDPRSGVTLEAGRADDGAIAAVGSAVMRAHDGALTVPLVGVRIADDALSIVDADDPGARMRLVTLHSPVTDGARTIWQTALAPEADLLFRYTYAPGVPFAPLTVDVTSVSCSSAPARIAFS